MRSSRGQDSFTLIELLIVVAIIAILAAIAVPNFLEAQIRAKCARVVSDMRTVATAIEAYFVDVNDYPRNFEKRNWTLPPDLTTPVAFLSTIELLDPFAVYATQKDEQGREIIGLPYYSYHRVLRHEDLLNLPIDHRSPNEATDGLLSIGCNPGALRKYGQWRMLSLGPDRAYTPPGRYAWDVIDTPYDPTNGTVSWGNIMRTQLSPDGRIPEPQP